MFWRVARYVAQAERRWGGQDRVKDWALKFYRLMAGLEFLPNSPTLLYAGRGLKQLSACFVLPLEDSLDSIFTTLKQAVDVQWAGGGTGFNFSKLRPFGDSVRGFSDVAAGPTHYLKVFDSALGRVMQGGVRHGANMGMLHISHPDIEKFIRLKRKKGTLANFNLSVAVSDKFMESYLRGGSFSIISPRTGKVVRKVRSEQLFDQLIVSAWETGEPGLLFWDRIREANPLKEDVPLEATNPCGEQPLGAYESCNLGSVNLARFAHGGKVSWEKLRGVVCQAVRFLNDVIEVNNFPLEQIKRNTLRTRKIGLGVMGLAHLFYKLKIAYNSARAEDLVEKLMKLIKEEGTRASYQLGKERGMVSGLNRRNATITTIAPTGSLSLIAGVSPGIEPVFSLINRADILWDVQKSPVNVELIDPEFANILKRHHLFTEEILRRVRKRGVASLKELPVSLRKVLVTAYEIDPSWHIRIQAAAQKYTDNAVSKTVNFPKTATLGDIRHAYILAWKLRCKGITIYRDGSRDDQVLKSVDRF